MFLIFQNIRYKSLAPICLITIFFMTQSLWAIDTKIINIPIVMRSDSTKLPSSFYMQCQARDFKDQSKRLSDLKSSDSNSIIKSFGALIECVETNDSVSFHELCKMRTGPSMPDEIKSVDETDKMLRSFRRLLENAKTDNSRIHVYEQLLLGYRNLVIWGSDKDPSIEKSVTFRNAFYASDFMSQEVRWSVAEKPDILQALLRNTKQHATRLPALFSLKEKAAESKQFDYKVVVPETTGVNQAYFLFDGKQYDYDLFSDEIPSSEEELSFYQEAYKALRNNQDSAIEDFAKYYTAESQAKVLNGFAKSDPEKIQSYINILARERQILFAVDADPFYVIFYRLKSNKATVKLGRRLHFEYVVKDPVSGNLKLTNYGYEIFIDDLFRSQGFQSILENILKPDEE